MKAIIYTRVSTDEQAKEGFSLAAQLDKLRQYAKAHKITIAKEFEDAGYSAGTKRHTDFPSLDDIKRPAFQAMRKYFKANKVDYILVWKTDRLSRDEMDAHMFDYECERNNVKMISITEEFASESKVGASIMKAFAAEEKRKISERTKNGLLEKLKCGGWAGLAPIGYRNSHDVQQDGSIRNEIALDPEKSHLIRALFQLYATNNYSLEDISKKMNDQGLVGRNGKILTPDQIRCILINKFYSGRVEHKLLEGISVKGRHEPLITQDLFDTAQMIVGLRSSVPSRNHTRTFVLRGLLVCAACGMRLTAEVHTKKSGLKFSYYSCLKKKFHARCDQPFIPVEDVESKAMDILKEIQLTKEKKELLKDFIHDIQDQLLSQSEQERNSLKQKAGHLERKQKELVDLVAEGTISRGSFSKYFQEAGDEARAIESRLAAINSDYSQNIDLINRAVDLMGSCKELFDSFDMNKKKALLKIIFKKIEVKDKKIVSVELNQPFEWVVRSTISPKNAWFDSVSYGVAIGI